MRHFARPAFLVALLACSAGGVRAADDFSNLIQNGNAQLQAGDTEAALKAADAAIHNRPSRWEGYALKGGALMDLKRYEDAADSLTTAIAHAPDDKKPALRELRRQSLSAESGASPDTKVVGDGRQTTQAEIVLWKTIENSKNPDDYRGYLQEYPSGAFAVLATQHLDALQAASAKLAAQEAEINERRMRDGVWTDDSTGLMWTRFQVGPIIGGGMGGEPEKDAALQVCAQFKGLHYSNWRLPTVAEAKTITSSGFMAVRSIRSEFSIDTHVDGFYVSDVYWKGNTIPIHGLRRDGYAPICVRDAK
jgi:Tetratricopeptide repeat